jgi:hypothetical protein
VLYLLEFRVAGQKDCVCAARAYNRKTINESDGILGFDACGIYDVFKCIGDSGDGKRSKGDIEKA